MASEMSVAEPAPAGGAAGGKQDPVVPDIVVYLCSFMIILVVVGGVFFLSFLMKTRLEAGMNASGPGGAGGPPPPGKLLALDEGDSGDFKVLNDEDPFHYKVAKARDGSQQHKVPFYEAAHLKEKSPQHKVAKHKQSLKKTTRQKRKTTVTRQKTTKSTKATKTTRRTTKRATTKAGRKMHAKMGPQDVTSSVTGVPKTSAKADQKTAPGIQLTLSKKGNSTGINATNMLKEQLSLNLVKDGLKHAKTMNVLMGNISSDVGDSADYHHPLLPNLKLDEKVNMSDLSDIIQTDQPSDRSHAKEAGPKLDPTFIGISLRRGNLPQPGPQGPNATRLPATLVVTSGNLTGEGPSTSLSPGPPERTDFSHPHTDRVSLLVSPAGPAQGGPANASSSSTEGTGPSSKSPASPASVSASQPTPGSAADTSRGSAVQNPISGVPGSSSPSASVPSGSPEGPAPSPVKGSSAGYPEGTAPGPASGPPEVPAHGQPLGPPVRPGQGAAPSGPREGPASGSLPDVPRESLPSGYPGGTDQSPSGSSKSPVQELPPVFSEGLPPAPAPNSPDDLPPGPLSNVARGPAQSPPSGLPGEHAPNPGIPGGETPGPPSNFSSGSGANPPLELPGRPAQGPAPGSPAGPIPDSPSNTPLGSAPNLPSVHPDGNGQGPSPGHPGNPVQGPSGSAPGPLSGSASSPDQGLASGSPAGSVPGPPSGPVPMPPPGPLPGLPPVNSSGSAAVPHVLPVPVQPAVPSAISVRRPVFCQFNHSNRIRSGSNAFDISELPFDFCTHFIYGSLRVGPTAVLLDGEPSDKGDLEKFAALKSKNPGLKLLVTIGGEEADDLALSQAFKDDTKQQLLTSSIATLVRNLALDGVNLHWVEPDLEGDVERDSAGLINFLKSLRNLLQTTLLAVTVPSDHEERIAVFNVKELSTVADYLFLSTHEVYSPYSAMTRFPGPAQDVDTGGMFTAISEVVQDLGQRPPKGLCFTVALHGVAYQVDPRARLDKYVPLANVTQSAHNHLEYAREGRALSYPELCSLQLNCNVAKVEKSCYDKVNDVWYGYVNEKTMASKVKWILQGGWENLCVVAWDIDMDDYAASCGTKARYPLLRSISAVSQALAY